MTLPSDSFPSPPNRVLLRMRGGLKEYTGKLRLFRRNARLFLLNSATIGIAFGIYGLLFNFYVLSLGYDEAMAGRLLTTSSLVVLVGALPMGYVCDRIGRKPAMVLSTLTISISVLGMVWLRTPAWLYIWNVLTGLSQSLMGVSMGPFLMENSGPEERTYLFSFSSGLHMTSGFFGNWLGGYLPMWWASLTGYASTDSQAYGGAMFCVGLLMLLALLPLLLITKKRSDAAEKARQSPLEFARRHPLLLGKLVSPMLLISLGAGLFMPFMNLFFRSVHHRSDASIGSLFAWGSLTMALGLLIAPPLADRWGKMRLVIASQSLSIPFLVLLGFSPWYWLSATAYLIRTALMNMSGPVYDTFVMEQVDESARATVASLASMCWSFGWAFSPTISGWLQVQYGFTPVVLGTIVTYILAIFLYWRFFWNHPRPAASA
jgi:MFS family permease